MRHTSHKDTFTSSLVLITQQCTFYFRKSSIQKGNLHLIKDDLTASDLDRYTFSNAMAHSVQLGTWEAQLEEYIDSVELVTQVSCFTSYCFVSISFYSWRAFFRTCKREDQFGSPEKKFSRKQDNSLG